MERSKGVGGSCSSTFQKQCVVGDRKASFSAYLRPEDGHAVGDDTTEISIFEAQKYFNETIIDAQKVSNHNNNNNAASNNRAISRPLANNVDNMEQLSRFSWASSSVHDEYASSNMGRNNLRARSFHAAATPTASSEASWNSQTGLLSHPRGTVAVSLQSPTHRHHRHQHHAHDHDQKKSRGMTLSSPQQPRVRWFSFPRRCPCSGKKAVRVEEKISSSSSPSQQPVNTSAAAAPRLLQNSSSNNDNVSRSISMDLRNQTLKSKSVVAARDEQHVMWDQEHGRRWEGQVTVKIQPRNSHTRLFTTAGAVLDKDSSSSNLPQMQHANGFSFPILKLNAGSRGTSSAMLKLQQPPLVKNSLNTTATLKQEPTLGWDSLEPHERQSSTTISISMHKPATTTTTGDHLSNGGFTFPASPKSRVIISNDDDLGSDASSDLFEIESFSASTPTTATASNYPSMVYQYNNYRRDSMEDDAPSFNAIRGLYRRRSSLDIEPMTPSSAGEYCYEPSEASIDWSVTTAEGLDRPSASSEADYHQDDELEKMSKRRSLSSSGGGGNYGLLSCRSEKAVSVGPNPVRLVGDDVMRHVGSRPPLPNKPRSHTPHLSIPFAT